MALEERLNEITKGLNDKQLEAVRKSDGKYLVLAGSGSGKTALLTRRVAYLIAQGVTPWQIVAISFTRKASQELSSRIQDLTGEAGIDVNTGTFHSLCIRILLKHQQALNMTNLTVLDEEESHKIVKELSEGYGYLKDAVKDVIHWIDYWGTRGIDPDEAVIENIPEDYISIYRDYIHFKRRVGYVDFDDILSLTAKLFDRRPDILEEYSSKYRYIMVDEVQDLSGLQFKIMRQLASYHGNYMCVGDDLQSVYAFRGGDVSNIMNIKQIDPDIETILLEQNYRSTNNIIQASNGFIAHNTKQLNKVSFTENQEGLPVMVYESEDELREAEYIVTMIEGMVQSGEYKYEDIAVLYRANYLSQNIALTFSSAGIPYDVQNGFNFYEREEVKTLVGYLRILDNPLDDIALEYILNRPKRSIGDVTVDRLKMYAAEVNIPLSVALAHADDVPKVNKPTKKRIQDFADLLDAMRAQLQNDPNIVRLLHYIVKQTGLMKNYDVQRTKDIERIDNIQELFNIAAMFELKDKEPLEEGQTSLSQFLTETALYAKPETGEELVGKVTLISSHGSKGMEYPVVFIIGLEQGIFPSYHALDDVDNLEEERRLMYVSMTRAEKVLFLSYNKKRYSFGRMQHCKPSQFIEELPKEYVKFLGK
mgnify:CR=1 FL=1